MALSGESALKKSANLESPLELLPFSASNDVAAPGVDILVPSPTNHRTMRSTVIKPRPYSCATIGCTKKYLRRGDLTRHIKEAHGTSGRLRCPIERCHANSPDSGFKRMHRLIEHLMKALPLGAYSDQIHPQLFSKADATWLAHDFNANSGDFQEIVFAANGSGVRSETDSVKIEYQCRVPVKYINLYFRVLCPVQECSFFGIPVSQRKSGRLPKTELLDHLQKSHGWSWSEAYTAVREGSAQAIRDAKAVVLCGLETES